MHATTSPHSSDCSSLDKKVFRARTEMLFYERIAQPRVWRFEWGSALKRNTNSVTTSLINHWAPHILRALAILVPVSLSKRTNTALSNSWSSYGILAGAVRLMSNSKGEQILLKNGSLHVTQATSWSAILTRLPGKLWLHLHLSLSLFHHPASKPLRRNSAQPVLSP